jgi:anti-sigma regulatory factor (Ser/Thr protein kinase)
MDNPVFFSYKINDRSYVSFIKREIHNLVTAAGYSSKKVGEIDIVVSELTSNIVKYPEEGELLYRVSSDEGGSFFEIYCIDDGDGIRNLARMRQDGMSTSNTLGQGLGAIERLSNKTSIYSTHGWGTVVHSKIYNKEQPHFIKKEAIEKGAIQVCSPGEKVCGDGYSCKEVPGGIQFFMGDGLGHGIHAHEAVTEAIQAFQAIIEVSPAEMLRQMHLLVKKTRGLVATIAHLDFKSLKWNICGIGNISTTLFTGLSAKNYTPHNGILGYNIPRSLNDSVLPFEKYQTLIMHSDGLRSRWNLTSLPGILKFDPGLISAVLYKDNARYNDDMTAMVVKIN